VKLLPAFIVVRPDFCRESCRREIARAIPDQTGHRISPVRARAEAVQAPSPSSLHPAWASIRTPFPHRNRRLRPSCHRDYPMYRPLTPIAQRHSGLRVHYPSLSVLRR
jgi:hypothetical protein